MRRAAQPVDPALATDVSPASGAHSSERLPLATFVAYGLPRLAMGFVGVVVALYFVKFGTDVLLIAPATMGADPSAGARVGRHDGSARGLPLRSHALALRTPSLVALRLRVSHDGGGDPDVVAAERARRPLARALGGRRLLLYETAQDVFLIPHGALGVELSQSYHERTRVFAWEHLFLALGTLCGLAAFALIEAGDPRARVQVFALVGGAALAATILFAAWRLPERAEYQGRGAQQSLARVPRRAAQPARAALLVMYAIETFGAGAIVVLAPYMAQYVYGDASLTTAARRRLPGSAGAPHAALDRARAPHRQEALWLAAMVVTCCGFMTLDLPARGRCVALILGVLFVLGVAAGVGAVCAPAIKADIIDFDEYRTGERKEGAYLAVLELRPQVQRRGHPGRWRSARCSSPVTSPTSSRASVTKWVMRGFFGILPGALLRRGDRDLPALPLQRARARRDPPRARRPQVGGSARLGRGESTPRAVCCRSSAVTASPQDEQRCGQGQQYFSRRLRHGVVVQGFARERHVPGRLVEELAGLVGNHLGRCRGVAVRGEIDDRNRVDGEVCDELVVDDRRPRRTGTCETSRGFPGVDDQEPNFSGGHCDVVEVADLHVVAGGRAGALRVGEQTVAEVHG